MFKNYLYDNIFISIFEVGNQQPRDYTKFKVHRLSSVVEEYIYKIINYIWKW